MKTFWNTLLCLVCLSPVYAQDYLDNGFFWDWEHFDEVTVGSQTYPAFDQPLPSNFWTTSNMGTRTIAFSPTCLKTTDAYDAPYACLLQSTSFPFGIAAGSLMAGDYKGGTDPAKAVHMGKPWNGRPERFVGFYKYIPVGNDYCKIEATLTRWNSSTKKQEIIATAALPTADQTKTVTDYTKFNLFFDYKSNDAPDSIQIIFTSSGDGANFQGGNGSALYIDHVKILYAGETGIALNDQTSVRVAAYPNPASDFVYFNIDGLHQEVFPLVVRDLQGREVMRTELTRDLSKIEVSHLDPGIYLYEITQQQIPVGSGRIVVQ
ncbi:PCMD domain-containing protein [bacterium SCSIO 12741]|nr:PCMD domain-containing protein [bacterium SCSIO 12741]